MAEGGKGLSLGKGGVLCFGSVTEGWAAERQAEYKRRKSARRGTSQGCEERARPEEEGEGEEGGETRRWGTSQGNQKQRWLF